MPNTEVLPPTAPSAKHLAAQARCAAMVAHAREQIMAVGVDRFSLNEALRLSGGSKATLAKYFGDRTGLIAAAIGEEAREWMARLTLDEPAQAAWPLEQALRHVLSGVLTFYLQPPALALYRAVIAASGGEHGPGAAFYRGGHTAVIDALAAMLEARKGAGVRADLDCRAAADILLHAIRAGLYEQALLGMVAPLPDDDAIARHIDPVVRIMLPGLSTKP